MEKDELQKKLSEPPAQKVGESPVITRNLVLPFNKLPWENFERFCFQLGSKTYDCLETSYIYGRKGQAQEGIDIYFNRKNEDKVEVYQVKRYQDFTKANLDAAVSKFLEGKWAEKVHYFTLCVSDYVDDTKIVDAIDKYSKCLSQKGITFSVLNSEKLTELAKKHPELIYDFFGESWANALGLVFRERKTINSSEIQNLSFDKRLSIPLVEVVCCTDVKITEFCFDTDDFEGRHYGNCIDYADDDGYVLTFSIENCGVFPISAISLYDMFLGSITDEPDYVSFFVAPIFQYVESDHNGIDCSINPQRSLQLNVLFTPNNDFSEINTRRLYIQFKLNAKSKYSSIDNTYQISVFCENKDGKTDLVEGTYTIEAVMAADNITP